MKGRFLVLALAAFLGVLMIEGLASAGGWVSKRQATQYRRIEQGVRAGEITKKEKRRLLREQERIQMAKRGSLRDCYLNPREKHRLDQMLDRASRDIYRAKHNKLRRRPWPRISRFNYPKRPWPTIPRKRHYGPSFYFKVSIYKPSWGFSWFISDP
ncbi:MAG: hypothetical protein JRJ03_01270 [Deltaproteobacteria bacterium]|nr:hypothetical protein [Deltaproteobacteria bacterium]